MFDEISVPATVWGATGRLLTAAALGAIVGIDREVQQKPAGLRTHALVSLGAALLALVGLHASGGATSGDPMSRIIQGIVSGIGFVGGGVILRGRDGNDVQGLTTAASIWVVAAVGIAAGVGLWRTALATVVIVVAVLVVGHPVSRWLASARPSSNSHP